MLQCTNKALLHQYLVCDITNDYKSPSVVYFPFISIHSIGKKTRLRSEMENCWPFYIQIESGYCHHPILMRTFKIYIWWVMFTYISIFYPWPTHRWVWKCIGFQEIDNWRWEFTENVFSLRSEYLQNQLQRKNSVQCEYWMLLVVFPPAILREISRKKKYFRKKFSIRISKFWLIFGQINRNSIYSKKFFFSV